MRLLTSLLCLIICVSCAEKEQQTAASLANPYDDKAYDFYEAGTLDSAFLYFSKSKEIYVDNQDSINLANCLIAMSIIQQRKADYFGSQESALEATQYLDINNPDHYDYIAPNYNVLGVSTYKLHEFDRAIEFYELALKYSHNATNKSVYQNNMGVVFHDQKKYRQAADLYRRILDADHLDAREYARTLTNYANTMLKIDPTYRASADLYKALAIREQEHDNEGLNSSYASLTEYYRHTKPDSAFYFARKQFNLNQLIDTPDDEAKALYRMSMLSPGKTSKAYFARYVHLNDSLQQVRAAAKNQFALIRYEVEKNKSDNLKLQKDNAEHINRLIRQRVATGSAVFILLLVVVAGNYYYKKRRQRLELEAENKIKASQLKTSQKVHDVVANGIYRVITEIEHRHEMDRNGILDQLEDVYNKSRDISYEAEGDETQPFAEQVAAMLKSFANEKHNVLIVGNETEIWDVLNKKAQEEVWHILQELMVNMKKHSRADSVVLRFEQDEASFHLYYADNGIGMAKGKINGNGLKNTGNRITNLAGKIIFAGEPGKGLKIQITVPIS